MGRSTIFDDVDSFSRHPEDHGGAGYQQESSILGLRCFDHQSEIDFLGNPLFRSMPRSSEEGQGIARFRTKHVERSAEKIKDANTETTDWFEW